MATPVVVAPVPPQIINEQAAYGPFDLNAFIQDLSGQSLSFRAEVLGGAALPKGMICTENGLLTGIPAKGTHGVYTLQITARSDDGVVSAQFQFTIKPSLIPDIDAASIADRPVTLAEIYHLLEQWATLTIWNALDLNPASEKKLLHLEGASKHFNVYDRGSSLVASPVDLFSQQRTQEDAMQTARAMAREVYKRGWIIELAGVNKMERATWVELQTLADQFGKKVDILNYDPSFQELRIYSQIAEDIALRQEPEQP